MSNLLLTFIVTIDPIKTVSHLDILIHSLNLQTRKNFNVIFHNQTLALESEILTQLQVIPAFPYEWHDLERARFFGKYPLWDLYAFHDFLLESSRVNPYFMSLHMEEFLDVDYVEKISTFLERTGFDIVFGNLRRTKLTFTQIEPILKTDTAAQFNDSLKKTGVKYSPHWAARPRWWWTTIMRRLQVGMRDYYLPFVYRDEDVYFMSVAFARRYNWFLHGHSLPLEDIHICEQEGVCELAKELRKLTPFPVYFGGSNIYHLEHEKYYYQFVDAEFTARILEMETDNPILGSLKKAIREFREGRLSLESALKLSRQNFDRAGTQDMNYRYHLLYLPQKNGASSEAKAA